MLGCPALEAGGKADDRDGDGVPADQDCNDDDDTISTAPTWYFDGDKDGHGDPGAPVSACDRAAGYADVGDDCDDTDSGVYPGAADVCDGRDEDCSGVADDTDGDVDGWPICADCDDADPDVRPDAIELCNEVDDDCAALVDDDDDSLDPSTATTVYADEDGDGFGNASLSAKRCEVGAGWSTDPFDCDDSDADVYPDAPELCNSRDDDCDAAIDDDDASLDPSDSVAWYLDRDGDGHGDDGTAVWACEDPGDSIRVGGDCDDMDPDFHPGASEADCTDLNDYNCDGSVAWVDGDGDAFTACEDCDDADAAVSPAGVEVCDGLDNDCDSEADESEAIDADTWYADSDGDGYGALSSTALGCSAPAGFTADSTDCDDTDASVNPLGVEACNGADDDCDGEVDEDSSVDASTWYADADGDGHGSAASPTLACALPVGASGNATDCDDADAAVSPDASESCNGFDDNCDGETDESTAVDVATWYADADGDGFGDASIAALGCDAPAGFVADATDCDDADATVSPAAPESCNFVDDDCDGVTDPSASIDAAIWYADADGDGYGFDAATTRACAQPAGHEALSGDCNDTSSLVNPAASEVCNGTDDDCDGGTDESDAIDAELWHRDADGDGYGDPSVTTPSCSEPAGYGMDDTDCDDSDADVFPGSTDLEVPGDGIDADCDGEDACTDLNCDGVPDLAFAGYYDGDYTLDSYATYGPSFPLSGRTSLANTGAYSMEAGDLDGDGYQDLLFANHYSGSSYSTNSYVYWGSASGYSSSDRTSLATLGALDALVEDLDGDGYADVVFANYASTTSTNTDSYIYWGSASGWSSADRTSLATNGARAVASDDLDDDGLADLVFCNYYSTSGSTYSTNSYVYWGSAAGYSASDRTSLATKGCIDVGLGDVNGDGWTDIAFANYYDGSNYTVNSTVYYGAAAGFSSGSKDNVPSKGSIGVEVSDVDNDGYDDVIYPGYYVGSWSTTAATYIYHGASTGLSSSRYTALVTTCGVRDPVVTDLNDDGWVDMAFARHYAPSSYSTNSYVYWGSSSGFTDTNRTSLPTVGATAVTAGDLDQDGYPDLAFTGYYSGSSYTTSQYVYWGSASGYASTDVTTVNATGVLAPIRMVGRVDW